MAALVSHVPQGLGTPSDSSPYTTASDDLFADINWPEDESESPISYNECLNGENGDQYENESPMVSQQKETHLLDLVSLTYIRMKMAIHGRQLSSPLKTVGLSVQITPAMLCQNHLEDLDSLRKLEAS